MGAISSFRENYRFLSNFWPATIIFGEMTYPSVEHAYVAAKTQDLAIRSIIKQLQKAGEAKNFGETLKPSYWTKEYKLAVMRSLIFQKFHPKNPELLIRLLETGDQELVEGNTWGDTFWGVCQGVGTNNLGKIIMERRTELILEKKRFDAIGNFSNMASNDLDRMFDYPNRFELSSFYSKL